MLAPVWMDSGLLVNVCYQFWGRKYVFSSQLEQQNIFLKNSLTGKFTLTEAN